MFDNMYKQARAEQWLHTEPGRLYDAVKKRLLKFRESWTERQLRVRGEWESLYKAATMSANQFEAKWESTWEI